MIKTLFYSFSFILISLAGAAQEGLRPLRHNLNYVYDDLKLNKTKPAVITAKTQSVSLEIPFLDDFSYAPTSDYPDQSKWIGLQTFVNSGYPVRPISIGVATFDGLNQNGYPYEPTIFNNNINFPSDTLTSRPINLMVTATSQTLQPSDSLALSFYFQPRGYGDPPEVNDSIVLDFYMPKQQAWARVWDTTRSSASGPNLVKGDTVFTRVFIWISDTAYLHDGFQFRFRNWSAATGNFDHWNIDYVYLDKNRSMKADTIYNDLSFAYVPTPFLRNYSSMPWEQYVSSEMAVNTNVKIRNNDNANINMTYKYEIDSANTQIHTYSGGATNLAWFDTTGYDRLPQHAKPIVNYTFAPMTDSMDYTIKHIVFRSGNNSDFVPQNDTVLQYQRFRNYYALDDGSAEAGYYVNASAARIGIKINVNEPDSFLAMRIYFDPVGLVTQAGNLAGFRVCGWASGVNGPGVLLFKDTIFHEMYYNVEPDRAFAELRLIRPQYLSPGTYYLGIQQLADVMTFGFDMNTDHHTSLYYDSGAGWTQSTQPGAIMIRPVFGRTLPHPVGIHEYSNTGDRLFTVYPNPASEEFIIQYSGSEKTSYKLINAMGQQVGAADLLGPVQHVNTDALCSGIYILMLKAGNGNVQQQKIIIHR